MSYSSISSEAMANDFTAPISIAQQPLHADQDVVRMRTAVREHAVEIGLNLVDQTKMVTAASELARNTLRYGGGGDFRIAVLSKGMRQGIRITFVDHGPGIADVALALKDGYSSGSGLGLGLGGAKRLADEFELRTEPGIGTTVSITKWTR